MKTRILIIDEDSKALAAYRDALASKSDRWTLECASSAKSGLDAAQKRQPDVVIVSFATGDGHGAELLSELETIAPDAQLFITATEDEKPKLESTFGASFQYLPNPCPSDRLITEIQRCVAIDNWLGNDRIKQLVAKMGRFPSVPSIYLKVVNLLNTRDAAADEIANAVAGDLAISAKLLQTVNSSYYGYDEKISDITQAVGILGTDCVKNLVLAIQVFNKMGSTPEHRAITDQLWHHSMSVAVAARRIANHETQDKKAAEEAYSAGLMHDIGKLVLLNAVPEQYAEARELAHQQSIPSLEAENQIIGCNHAETGAYLLARWGMPASLTEAVALHHDPINSFAKSFSALAAVHIANAIAHHRQRPDHPSAKPCEEFLIDLGKTDSWQTWIAVSSGKQPSAANKLSLKSTDSNAGTGASDEPETITTSQAKKKPESKGAAQPHSNPETASPSKLKTPLFSLAACLTLAAGSIYFLNTFDPSPQEEVAYEELHQEAETKAMPVPAQSVEAPPEIAESSIDVTIREPEPPEPKSEQMKLAQAEETKPEPPPQELPKPKLPEPKDPFPNLELAGIFYNADRPLASVNGQIRKTGDTVSGAKIIRIDQNQIVVQHESTVRAIKLK